MRRRRNAIVLGVSLAAHLALVVAWISTRPDLAPAESPTLQVQLVRLPPKVAPPPPPAPRNVPPPPVAAPPRPLELHPPPPLPQPPPAPALEISPEWRVKRSGGGVDLDAAPFVLGRAGLKRAREPKADCKTHGWNRPLNCPPDATELAAARSDPAKDSKTGGFAAEGARKLTMKSYRESPSTSDYPGLACSIFHKC